jgi:uncharacterized delta-60 repeat protein
MASLRAAVLSVLMITASAVGLIVTADSASAASPSSYLDPSFGQDGLTQVPAPIVDVPIEVAVVDSALMADGRVVVAGSYEPGGCANRKWWVGRFTADGAPDATFGGGTGAVLFAPPGLSACATQFTQGFQLFSVAVQSTGKIVLGGSPNLAVRRLDVDGSIDSSFAAGFSNSASPSCFGDHAPGGGYVHDLIIDSTDRIIVAGSRARSVGSAVSGCPTGRFAQGAAIVRFTADGNPGTELTAPWGTGTSQHYATRVALLADETPVAVAGTSLYWLGSLQLTVSNAYNAVSTVDNDVIGLDVDSQDRVLLGTLADDYYTLALRRFGAGAVDASFGTNGLASSTAVGRAAGLAVDSSDGTVVFGTGDSQTNNQHFNDLRLARFTPAGSLDASFGNAGVRTDRPVRNFGPSSSAASAVALRADGSIAVVGIDGPDTVVFGRYDSSGVPDPALSADGFTFTANPTTSPTEQDEELIDLQTSPSGSTFGTLGRSIVKFGPNGVRDSSFGESGILTPPPGMWFFAAMPDHSNHLIVQGVDDSTYFIGRLDTDSGAFDPTFGDRGVTLEPGCGGAVAIDSSDRIVVTCDPGTPAPRFRLLRLRSDGTPDPSFGSAGVSVSDIFGTALSIDPAGRITVAGLTTSGPYRMTRFTDSGQPDPSFQLTGLPWIPSQLLLAADGSTYLTPSSPQVLNEPAVVRVRTDGGLDPGFADNGELAPPSDLSNFRAALDSSGRLLLTGSLTGTTDVVVSRYSPAGTLDTTYASNGRVRVRIPLAAGIRIPTGRSVIAVPDSSDKVVVGVQAQIQNGYTSQVFSLVRVLADPAADGSGPVVTVTSPADGATYLVTDSVSADYGCADAASGVDTCAGDVANGAPVPLVVGAASFTVTGTDLAGNVTTRTVHYTVSNGAPADSTPPTIQIAQPADGSSYTVGQNVVVDYSCADAGGSGLASCTGSVPTGSALDTTVAGTHSVTVDALDGAGNQTHATSTYEVLAGNVTATVTGPATVTTDPGGLGASTAVPIQTRLEVPAGVSGTVSADSQPVGAAPTGFVLFSRQIVLSGPVATGASTPYVVTFSIDSSEIGSLQPNQVEVFRNGVQVPVCTSPTDATPDPCIADRSPGGSGDVNVTVRTTQFSTWTFGRRDFVTTSASPSSRAQGSGAQTLVVTGYGFNPGVTTKVSGTGVSVVSTTRVSATSLQVAVSVGGSAGLGAHDITVTNPGKVNAVCTACFTVNPKPTVTSLAPSSRPQGAGHAVVVVTGTGLQAGASASFSGTGVTVNSANQIDSSHLSLDVSIDTAAAVGGRAITVLNPDGGTVTKSAALVVNALPTVTAVNPSKLRQGVATSATITGSGFPADFVASGGTVSFGDGVAVVSVVRNSTTKLTVSVSVSGSAALGSRTVQLVNPDGGSASCTGCTAIVADPSITAITPSSRARGTTAQTVTVTGSGFQPGALVKISGSGVTIASTTVDDSTTMTLQITVGGSAALGARDVTITNADTGTTTCTGCFTVSDKPTIGTLTPSSRARGSTDQTVQLSGTGLQAGLVVTFSGTGVTATVVSVTPTSATLTVTVAASAATGSRSVTVSNLDGGTATKANSFKVT